MNKNILKKVFAIVLMLVIMFQIYLFAEPVVASGVTASDGVVVTLTVDEGITISNGADSTMTPNIGVASDGSIGSSSWIVRTNNTLGYNLSVKASTNPALKSGTNTFEDYTEGVVGTPELWSVGAGAKEFGYSAYGTDTATGTWGTSASCGSGSTPAADQKYVGFKTTDKVIATKATVTPTSGITTNICFAAQQNGIFAASGTYTATITATAVTI